MSGIQENLVFVSASRQDQVLAELLREDLMNHGFLVWTIKEGAPGGKTVAEQVADGIRQAQFFLFVNRASHSDWTAVEMRVANKLHKTKGIPFIFNLDFRGQKEALQELSRFVNIDFSGGYSHGFSELLEIMQNRRSHACSTVTNDFETDENEDFSAYIDAELAGKKTPTEKGRHVATLIMAVGAVAAVIALVPAFKTAFGNQPNVIWSYDEINMQVPEEFRQFALDDVMRENNIPNTIGRLYMANIGDAAASPVSVDIEAEGEIQWVNLDPAESSHVAWLTYDKDPLASEGKFAQVRIDSFAASDQALQLIVAYSKVGAGNEVSPIVIASGKSAKRVDKVVDSTAANSGSWFSALTIPAAILVGAILASIIAGGMTAVLQDEILRKSFAKYYADSMHGMVLGVIRSLIRF